MTRRVLSALACLAPLVALTLIVGPLPDSDRAAHTLWAGELLREGRLTISADGVVDNWRMYYPNTVPKPGDLVLSLFGVLSGPLGETLLWLLLSWAVIFGAMACVGAPAAAVFTGVFLGINPVFLNLCITRSPAVPFMALLFLGGAFRSPLLMALSSLVRPEGFIYGIRGLRRKLHIPALLIMAASAAVWAVINSSACGDLFWSGREVRYCVAAMDYSTPNVITYPPWLMLRAVFVLGPLPLAFLVSGFRNWELRLPVGLNLGLLWAGLAFGSLVLNRYADQVILLAVPFSLCSVFEAFPGGKRVPAAALCLVGAMLPWMETAVSWQTEIRLNNGLRALTTSLPEGIVAANELVVPRLALIEGPEAYPHRYVALDRAIWEGAGEDALLSHGVTSIVIFRDDFYLSDHAGDWMNTLSGRIPVFDITTGEP